MRIRLTERAVSDLSEARAHYDAIDGALGSRFAVEVDAAVERLEMFPLGAPPVEGVSGVRRARLRRFPYGVIYRAPDGDDELWIIRVLRAKRDFPAALDEE